MSNVRPEPLPGIILIETITQQHLGGLQIPSDKEEENKGVVVAIGGKLVEHINGKEITTFPPPDVSVGDTVFFEPSYQRPVSIEGESYRFVPFQKVWGVVKK